MVKNPTRIYVDSEYLKLVPRMSPDQREALKESIREKGLLQPLEVSRRSGKVLDGMTRFDICHELKIIPTYNFKDFLNDEEEKEYAIIVNLKRRQLNLFQQVELLQDLRKKFHKEKRAETSQYLSKVKKGEIEVMSKEERLKTTTTHKIAKLVEAGPAVVDQAHYILDHGTELQIKMVREGKIAINHMYRTIVNKRHQMPDVVKRNTRVFPKCPKCGGQTRFKGKCHVHKQYCCRFCDGGV